MSLWIKLWYFSVAMGSVNLVKYERQYTENTEGAINNNITFVTIDPGINNI